ncbi:unnamed protein product [Orchesella dallaii]|uniref:Secreted protein n=1 Tax=Orchesella dallaii TaxID=48710 RepID=A0ABP1QD39_9HEXA
MISAKFFSTIFLGVIAAHNFIIADSFLIPTSIGNSTTNDFSKSPPNFSDMRQVQVSCPRGTGLKWLLYGRPSKCYQSGSQGPCRPKEILVPDRSQRESIYGVCKSVIKLQPTVAPHQAPAKLTEISGTYVKGSTYDIKHSKCQENERYSKILKRCIKNALYWGKGGSTIG